MRRQQTPQLGAIRLAVHGQRQLAYKLARFVDADHVVGDHAQATGEIIVRHAAADDQRLIVADRLTALVEHVAIRHHFRARAAVIQCHDAHATALAVTNTLLVQNTGH